jgi:hypothetical protein
MLNWRPVVDYELREIEFKRSKREQRKIALEQCMKQLESENVRIAELNAKLSALSSSSATNSSPTNSRCDFVARGVRRIGLMVWLRARARLLPQTNPVACRETPLAAARAGSVSAGLVEAFAIRSLQ